MKRPSLKKNKITLTGKSKIIDDGETKYVIKEKNKDLKSLYDYLNTRQFRNYPEIINEDEDNYYFDYIKSVKVPINQKASDMANLLALLHNKTAYFKPITADYIKEIYENIESNIIDVESFYTELIKHIKTEEIMSPSNYLLIRNSSKLLSNINFLKKELEKWFKMITEKTKERVVYCHNNLSIDHFLSNTEDYFISWDNYSIDTPVLDLISLFKNDYNKYEFSNFFEVYNQRFPLNDEEKKLFFIMISIPKKINITEYEYNNTTEVNNLFTYIYKTEKLIRPYYTP